MFERILVIESDSQVQKYMGSFLEKHKYQCVLTDKGKVGWSVLRNSSMDLIILDMMLEDYGALEFIRDVRSVSQIPIIATSFMKGEDAIVIEALECGADDYIDVYKRQDLRYAWRTWRAGVCGPHFHEF